MYKCSECHELKVEGQKIPKKMSRFVTTPIIDVDRPMVWICKGCYDKRKKKEGDTHGSN